MTLLKFGALSLRIAYYRWALAHLCASHPDVPEIVLHVKHLEDQRNALTAQWIKA
jgi:hypothetical protein